jgi:rubrerythrin
VARYLAETAYLEAASIVAFERMAHELEVHAAPKRLVAAARRAARDEVRHARVTKRLAERAGATVPECRIQPSAARSLEEIALENVREGCVRETFGAAVGLIQAERARDPQVRRAMRRIARDETRHAELSWAVARWLDARLDQDARDRVAGAQSEAIETLERETTRDPDPLLQQSLGIPSAPQARAAIAELRASLWSPPARGRA